MRQGEDDGDPTPERRTKAWRIERTAVVIEGTASRPWRILATLDQLERRGSITALMHRAGDRFGDDWAAATFDTGLFAADPTRIPVLLQGVSRLPPAFGCDLARATVAAALDALGGLGQPGAACAWWVLGAQLSLTDWAKRGLWLTRPIRVEMASGILVSALGVLIKHYGLNRCQASG